MEKMEKIMGSPLDLSLKKFRTSRDKSDKSNGHGQGKAAESGAKARDILSIFKPESVRQAQKEREEGEKEAAKIVEIKRLLQDDDAPEDHVRLALNSKFAAGDVDKAVELLKLQRVSLDGLIVPGSSKVQMLGAENRGAVTCYLDALLFAMFAKLSAFECMLKDNPEYDEGKRKLAFLLRLWVNMLRTGKLIHTDITQEIQETLASCGWRDAELLQQQDTSEAFAFITETLQLPLLALQVDLFHQGEKDEDDHKVVHERLLNLAIPPDPEGRGVKLEDCLEEYFNTTVDVLRDTLEEKRKDAESRRSIRIVSDDGESPATEMGSEVAGSTLTTMSSQSAESSQTADKIAVKPVPWASTSSFSQSPLQTPTSPFGQRPVDTRGYSVRSLDSRPAARSRSASLIQRISVGDSKVASPSKEKEPLIPEEGHAAPTMATAITIPAWQFFRLIPWHATSNSEPSNDAEVAMNFDQRPVLGICLKRYMMTEEGLPIRHNTLVDIPDSLRLPRFMIRDDADIAEDPSGLSGEYKLVLQSVVCHRGNSLHSGHYISFARVAPKLLKDDRHDARDPPPCYEEARWAKFDDLDVDNRVTFVDDIKEALREEMPYLLFYQIVPIVDVCDISSDESIKDPPSYIESSLHSPSSRPARVDSLSELGAHLSRPASGYFDSSTTLVQNGRSASSSPGTDLPPFHTGGGTFYGHQLNVPDSRRGSAALSDTYAVLTPESQPSPTFTPAAPSTPQEENTGTRLSRAAAMFSGMTSTKSRPASQASEGRTSLSIFGAFRPATNSNKEVPPPQANNTNGGGSAGEDADNEEAVTDDEGTPQHHQAKHSGEEKEKDRGRIMRLHHHYKKDRSKSKSQPGGGGGGGGSESKTSSLGMTPKAKKEPKEPKKSGVPERECVVM
ncbi:ubiquitin C-terminal hydrolase [Podospora conica]|nr:ubiquitin C-terminal hydrolase [Schizothecium conicum]